jgi:uncharacterized protein
MSSITTTPAANLLETFARRRSVRRLTAGPLSDALIADLIMAADLVPSAFDAQPWRVVILHDRHDALWDMIERTITRRLDGDRRARYLARVDALRGGGMTLLVFEDVARAGPQDNLTHEEARDQASQSVGMLQLALWLTLTAHGMATSLQHWQWLMEDVALTFVGLPAEGFRLVTFMPVGSATEPPVTRATRRSRVSLECTRRDHDDPVTVA